MHLNTNKPNILNDMLAAARGIDLRNRNKIGLLTAKKYNQPAKVYPYSSERQDKRNRKHVLV
jgi:hypothetical protein